MTRALAVAILVMVGCGDPAAMMAAPVDSQPGDAGGDATQPPRDCTALGVADATGTATCRVLECLPDAGGGAQDCCRMTSSVDEGTFIGGRDVKYPRAVLDMAPAFTPSMSVTGKCFSTFQEQNVEVTQAGGTCTFSFTCTLVI